MASIDLAHLLATLGARAWPFQSHSRARVAAGLALTIYAGHTRDQGTPYLHHPLAVVTILRSELGVTLPETLLVGLLHDALEVDPGSESLVVHQLGEVFAARLRAMTPDHRLARRPKEPGDEIRWRMKTAALPAEDLLVRLADRVHNLRDLAASPNSERRSKFIRNLADFHLPLAEAARPLSPQLATAHALLHHEYVRHQQEVRP
ncbi:HD domain-containing protein [Streptomyces sp. TS71-3]|uniref:HD domain-containing protein n=1 Tax=Streptomyces sp. TS71-3 TaxID=2733862 RepID=UPI001BB30E4F|nr:HD domain-containing protein [Streptomyces sp. TS71-3]